MNDTTTTPTTEDRLKNVQFCPNCGLPEETEAAILHNGGMAFITQAILMRPTILRYQNERQNNGV
jgi:hypothetical protein